MIYTVGHSTRPWSEFLGLLSTHDIAHVVDVRRYPGSRRYPQFGREALAAALAEAGIGYEHAPDLGGRRSARADSRNTAWRSAAFRGYADHMESPEFQVALGVLLEGGRSRRTAILCAEALPWRCHRHLIADALLARGEPVAHILSDASPAPHQLSPHARVLADGGVRYPANPV